MHSVKLTLLNFHFWNVLVDLMLNVFAIPIPLFPSASGFLLGLFSYWGIRQTIQLWILITSICFVCVSTMMIFENRFRLFNRKNKHWKEFQPFWVFGNILFVFMLLVPTMLQFPDQEQARQMVFSTLPCIPDFLYSTEIIVPSLNIDIIVITVLVFILVVFGQLLTFAIVLIVQLSSNFGANLLSESTRRLQKNLLTALIWQTGIPLMYLALPSSISMMTIALGIYSRPLNNINIAVMSLHGLVSTLSMILIHKPYRSTVVNFCKKKGTRENSGLVNNYPLFTTDADIGYYATH
ncbi:unnamed protein product [Caenorhabditis nigoni]